MATSTRSLRWHPHDLSRFDFADVRRLTLPSGCRFDALGLDADGRFAGVCVRWPTDRGPAFRPVVLESIHRWWRSLGRSIAAPLRLVVPLHQPVRVRPRDSRPRLRELLDRAMRELRGEFDRAIQRKLAQLMGDGEPRERPIVRSLAITARASKGSPREEQRAAIRNSVLAALADGRPRARGELLSAARLFEDQAQAVRAELHRLQAEGRVVVVGRRGSTKYQSTGLASVRKGERPGQQ